MPSIILKIPIFSLCILFMKKTLLLILVVIFANPFASAQDVRFGLKAGANLANVSSSFPDTGSLQRFHLGGMMEAKYNSHWALQPEILYAFQGFEVETNGRNYTYKLSYINVPVMVKYFPIDLLYLEAGPQIGFLHRAKEEVESTSGNTDSNIKDGMRSNDLGLGSGVGLQLANGWGVGARYIWGLTNISKSRTVSDIKNSVLQFYIAYFF